MSVTESIAIKEKFTKGLELTRQRLVALKKKEGGELVFSKDAKIITVAAKDLK
ncbi:MAG TPA: hypothetical protein PLJ60_01315 [Chryseolinea sp.]|nr:hypothetical protein [Chryseolinea sp.]HPM28945.1 hypothetical protein [Chryseolinea sp.]